MEQALELLRGKDTKERMAGMEHLHSILESSRKPLSTSEVDSLVDTCLDLLKDSSNFRVSQGALQCLASAAVLSGEHLKLHLNGIVPCVVERLGDAKQPVRDAARHLFLTLMEVSSPTIIVERAGSFAWTHRNWRVREEFARTVTSAITIFASTEPTLQRVILPPILQMLNDSNQSIKEAAMLCIEEMYTQFGPQFCDELQRHHLPTFMVKDINNRLERIEPKVCSSDGLVGRTTTVEMKSVSQNMKKSSPKKKSSLREMSISGGEIDLTEKHIDPVTVYSEKELIREVEKIASTLVPEKDWSIRIASMQRFEALVIGGAAEYPCFPALLKQLVTPLSAQLSDRRSSIVKQACHLLSFLSKELLGDFEACAEMFIPVLFKLVVITVLIIAESGDNCIKTMLRNCKVFRVLPRIADCAKNDRSPILRARCCEYLLLMLEYWADAPEMPQSADLYEDLIKCCVADAMSEVRATARHCYRMFAKTWPERSQRLFLSFDPVIQRVINDEDGGMHRRHASASLRDGGVQVSRTATQTHTVTNLPGYGTSAVVAVDKSTAMPSSTFLSSGLYPSEVKSLGNGTERSLEIMLHASKQKVTAIESMLSSLNISEKQRSTSLDLGVDPPSARDPPFPPAVTANAVYRDSTASTIAKALSSSFTGKRASERLEGGSLEENADARVARRFVNTYIDKQYVETPYKDAGFRDSESHIIPHFQRPLLRKHVSGRVSVNSRNTFDDNQILLGEMSNYVDGPASLQDALTEGLGPSSDWFARVAAFNYVRSLLQQDPKGTQEVMQNFEKVMKLFFQHLDDPHHKVSQAALSALAEIIPAYRKPFESYLDRTLHHVFSRLIDPKESVRQLALTTLEVVSKTYGIDSLLPALLRSLDEQRSPKVKLAVIEYAISSFNKNTMNTEGAGNSGILKLWLAKLTPLVYDKNTKLKEAAISCILSVYSHFDSTSVINFMLSMSAIEQNSLRRALRQLSPRIEVDLMNILQNKRERQRPRNIYDTSDVGISSDDGYSGALKKTHVFGRYTSGSTDNDDGKNWSSSQEPMQAAVSIDQMASNETQEHIYQNLKTGYKNDATNVTELNYNASTVGENKGSCTNRPGGVDHSKMLESYLPSPRLDVNLLASSNHLGIGGSKVASETVIDINRDHENFITTKFNPSQELGISIPQVLHQISNGNESSSARKQALQQLIEASIANNHSIWTKYFNQILTVVLEVLDDSDSSIREATLSLLVEILNKQKDSMEDSIEIIIEKLLHLTEDMVAKVSNEAEKCLSIVLSEYDQFKCLSVIVPLLITEDEKTLVTCINCLTKLVGRLSEAELLAQLPSFLPALFDAFGNQSADVRKTVVFCLVDIYIMLGKPFLPYLEDLNSTQLRLVTIYANRISQARTGTTIDAIHG